MGWLKNALARVAGKKIAKQIGLKEGDNMEDKKSWIKSKTVWAGVLSVAIAVYNAAREPLGSQFGVTLPAIPEWAFALLGGLGVYGRAKANTSITK